MNLTIVIPCHNEAENLQSLLPLLLDYTTKSTVEILVVLSKHTNDGSSSVCRSFGFEPIQSEGTQRSMQMNHGAELATGDILFFLHADVRPPSDFLVQIEQALDDGFDAGIFSYRFDSDSKILKFNSYFTRFDGFYAGGGDQGLFIKTEVFERLGRFDDHWVIMEDFDFFRKLKKQKVPYTIIQSPMTVSARKYKENSWFKVNLINLIAVIRFKTGSKPQDIRRFYKKWIKA